MRPPRQDIAAPPFAPGTEWVGDGPRSFERLLAERPALVHFLDFAQLNCVRALPYLSAWADRYREAGLAILGVHSPRFSFTRDAESVAEALPRLGVEWPVALDPALVAWRDYGCQGWPSLFLWGKGGVLRWYHLGEGEYEATEEAIREALEEIGGANGAWPAPVEPLRPSDTPGAEVVAPTAELFPGGSIERPWSAMDGHTSLSVDYEAGGAYTAVDGEGTIELSLDGEPAGTVEVRHPGLHELTSHERHETHSLELVPSPAIRVHSLQFAPGPPA